MLAAETYQQMGGCTCGETGYGTGEWITALATVALVLITGVAAWIALRTYTQGAKNERVGVTVDLLREWAKPKYQSILGLIDERIDAESNRSRATAFYRLSEAWLKDDPWAKTTKLTKKKIIRAHNAMAEIDLLASRTWALVSNAALDEKLLFEQISYEILVSYFVLEDVIAARSVEETMLYNDFRSLALRAQRHYRQRPYREIVQDLGEAWFQQLPTSEVEYKRFRAARIRDKLRIARYIDWCEAHDDQIEALLSKNG